MRENGRSPAGRGVFFLLLLRQCVLHEGWISRCAFVFRTPAETYVERGKGGDRDFDEWVAAADYTGNAITQSTTIRWARNVRDKLMSREMRAKEENKKGAITRRKEATPIHTSAIRGDIQISQFSCTTYTAGVGHFSIVACTPLAFSRSRKSNYLAAKKTLFLLSLSNRLRQPDAQDRRWQADDHPVRAGGHPAHAALHDQHRAHTRLQLQVHLQQVLQVGK